MKATEKQKEYFRQYYLKNREKKLKYVREYKLKNPDIYKKYLEKHGYEKYASMQRKSYLKRTYNVTLEEYEKKLKQQNNCCAICSKNIAFLGSKLAVDHNHTTNQNRGLLCINCNTALGGFKDNIKLLQKAINYLNYYNG